MPVLSRRLRTVAPAIMLIAAATVTAIATSAPAATAVAGASPCSATFTVAWQTPSNSPPDFGATITVTNNATYPITNWTITLTFGAGQTVVPGSPFSVNVTQSGATVTATPAGSF